MGKWYFYLASVVAFTLALYERGQENNENWELLAVVTIVWMLMFLLW